MATDDDLDLERLQLAVRLMHKETDRLVQNNVMDEGEIALALWAVAQHYMKRVMRPGDVAEALRTTAEMIESEWPQAQH